mmetsp:Transcript_27161/g.48012  ORF Transcript_27161/g.48012 Transcript_27161/m.48012 type:complete len:235 (+) Transcript_27161:295-999(+)
MLGKLLAGHPNERSCDQHHVRVESRRCCERHEGSKRGGGQFLGLFVAFHEALCQQRYEWPESASLVETWKLEDVLVSVLVVRHFADDLLEEPDVVRSLILRNVLHPSRNRDDRMLENGDFRVVEHGDRSLEQALERVLQVALGVFTEASDEFDGGQFVVGVVADLRVLHHFAQCGHKRVHRVLVQVRVELSSVVEELVPSRRVSVLGFRFDGLDEGVGHVLNVAIEPVAQHLRE